MEVVRGNQQEFISSDLDMLFKESRGELSTASTSTTCSVFVDLRGKVHNTFAVLVVLDVSALFSADFVAFHFMLQTQEIKLLFNKVKIEKCKITDCRVQSGCESHSSLQTLSS